MDVKALVLGVLREVESAGLGKISRTSLIKFIYLTDVYTAEETGQGPASDIEWSFLHFGPYSQQLARDMERLVTERAVLAEVLESDQGDREFNLYSLPEYSRALGLRDLGIPGRVQTRIQSDLKRFGKDLPALLDRVYFHTSPMKEVKPGEVISFAECQKLTFTDVKPLAMKKLDSGKVKAVRSSLRELIEKRKRKPEVPQGSRDDIYVAGMELLDGDDLDTGLSGFAKIKI